MIASRVNSSPCSSMKSLTLLLLTRGRVVPFPFLDDTFEGFGAAAAASLDFMMALQSRSVSLFKALLAALRTCLFG